MIVAAPQPIRMRISGAVRRAVIERDGRVCQLCSRPVVIRSARSRRQRDPHNQLTLDHIVPVSSGGAATIENLRVCCRECNMGRSYNSGVTSASSPSAKL